MAIFTVKIMYIFSNFKSKEEWGVKIKQVNIRNSPEKHDN